MIRTFFLYLISEQTFNLLKSILTVSFVSTLCGFAAQLCDKPFWSAFLLSAAIQLIVGYILATYTYSNYKKTVYLAELDKLEKLSTILNCAYCNEPTVITFLPDQVPDLNCEKCKNVSSVKLQFAVTRTTTIAPTSSTISAALKEPQKNHKINL